MKKIILFPFNGNAREAVSVILGINREGPQWEMVGFIDDDEAKWGLEWSGLPVLGGREVLDHYPEALVLAVPGRPENFRTRASIIDGLGLPPGRFASIVHPSADLTGAAAVGYNTLIMANVTATADVVVGNHVVILPHTVLSHDVTIGDYCLLGSNVSLSGGVGLGRLCYVGSGSRIIQEATVGAEALVGLGSVVIGDVEPGAVVAGNPARVISGGGS